MDRAVAVTGASKGIGRALAIAFSRKGWRVALLARNEQALYESYTRLTPHPGEHLVQPCDISVWTDCQNAADRVAERFGGIDLLINNAFGSAEKSLAELDPGDIHDFFETSVNGTVLITKAFLPVLQQRHKAHDRKTQIINIVADWGFPMHNILTGTPSYVAAKYAIHGFGVALHRDVASTGINVTNVYPGIVASALDIDDPMERVREVHGDTAIPLSDLVSLVTFLTTLESSVIRHVVISPDNPVYNGL